ncbi:DUF2846 domain-containing protein [Litoribrevibacter euphylliae]|uniref:DUF2846 domain-containing protein n=1 Tax=Litoribrevibacter euphylliae TaxID=1834034 RepID=A0ABV7HHI9_9GAMM
MKKYLVLLVLILQGCAMGPIYKDAPPVDNEKALIYLMRGDIHYGGGYATSFRINDSKVVELYDNGYSWIHLTPGTYKFSAGGERLSVKIEPGETYYIELHQEVKSVSSGVISQKNILQSYDKQKIYE